MSQKTIAIKITEKECKEAGYVNPDDCPIARAFKKRGYKNVSVSCLGVSWDTGYAKAVVSKTDRKRFGFYGRNSMAFIEPLINKANNGETFTRIIRFKMV